jgi:hypothetical protein
MNASVLTEELLAYAERICRGARVERQFGRTSYDEASEASAGVKQGPSAGGKTKWLT